MAEIKEVFQIATLPGVKRDGTNLDGDNFVDGQWVRWIRGRVRKMGGYQEMLSALPGVVRGLQVWARNNFTLLIAGSRYGVTQATFDENGGAGTSYDRTPTGWGKTLDGAWTLDTLYDSAVGSEATILVAHRNNALANIYDDTDTQVYWGVINSTSALEPISGLSVSGGVCAVAPYLVYYGSDGLVGWSDANQPRTLTGGDAGQARVTGAKIVKALPFRSGSGPAALLWSLDSVIRMDYIGGSAIFKFSTVTNQSSILSQNSVIEYDGDYFWIGVDRFLTYSGGKVQEVPNLMNKNWFFDNLNYAQRQKVWATKVPRFGEIIWFFPSGGSEECDTAIVLNVNEKTWYDFKLSRTAGYFSQIFPFPIWVGGSSQGRYDLTLENVTGTFTNNELIRGDTSGASARVNYVAGTYDLVVQPDTPTSTGFVVGESVTGSGGATADIARIEPISSGYIHDKGWNAITAGGEQAIQSWFQTSDFGYPTGGAQQNNIKGLNRWTRLIRVEPDFVQNGDMSLQVVAREFAQSPDRYSESFTFGPETGKIDMREQGRQIRLRFESNTLDGHFEMGRVILHSEPGDVRS